MAEPRWVRVAEFGAQYEADLARVKLEAEGIPVLVKGPETGIFGPGIAGPTPLGVSVWVPEDAVDRAREVLA